MTNLFSSKNLERETERLNPPKITDNSVFLYQTSSFFATNSRAFRSLDIPGIIGLTFFHSDLTSIIFVFGICYAIFANGILYEPSRRLVIRMDLLPDSETLFIQKIGFGGFIYGQHVLLDDIEKLDIQDCEKKGKNILTNLLKENLIWLNHHSFDRYMIYQNKKTKEKYYFDRNGTWDSEGIKHPLIN